MFELYVGKVPVRRMHKPEGASPFDPETRHLVTHYDEMVPGFSMHFFFPDEQLHTGRRGEGELMTDEQLHKTADRAGKNVLRMLKERRDYLANKKES